MIVGIAFFLHHTIFLGLTESLSKTLPPLITKTVDLFLLGSAAPGEEDDFENQCKICMDASIDCVLLECGHMVTCTKCGKQITDCPVCRQNIARIVHVFKA